VRQPDAVWLLLGGGFYLIGTVAVTGLGTVPLNNALAAIVNLLA
jgi:uncharacterized membrane protein